MLKKKKIEKEKKRKEITAYFQRSTGYLFWRPGGGVLKEFLGAGWGCAVGTLEPLTYTRASSAEFCYSILE